MAEHPVLARPTVPGVFGTDLLAGEWKFATTFNQAGQPVTVSTPTGPVDPAVGGDPVWDQSTTQYNSFGLPVQLWPGDPSAGSGTARYVAGTGFDDVGRVTSRTLALATTGDAMQRGYGYNTSTGVLDTIKAGWTTVGGTPAAWFQNDVVARDAVGNVTSVTDNGLEPGGVGSGVKECFLYDSHNRLVRAHSATPATACATTTTSASVAAGSLDAYDQTWSFDDINRITARTDKLTSTTTAFAYTGSKHAVVGLSGGTTVSYGYNQVGAMTSRDGTTLTYDALQRLTSYGTTETYLYGTSNQRLVRTAGTTRTLYLPGMEVTDTAGTVTVTKWLTIGGTTIGTKTTPAGGGSASVAWNCGSLQNSVVCQAPATSAGTIPARKRYRPYGDERNTVTLATTDHGFLNQPEDSTGLTYLNNRYYDPGLDNFVSVDPLVGKTGTPYLYANGNPATLSDPSGLEGRCLDGSVYGGSRYTSVAEIGACGQLPGLHYEAGYCAHGCFKVGIGYLTRSDASELVHAPPAPAEAANGSSDQPLVGPGDYISWIEASADALSKDAVLMQTVMVDGKVTVRIFATSAGAAFLVTESNVTLTVQSALVPASYAGLAGAIAKTMKVAGAALTAYSVGEGVLNGFDAYERSGGGYENFVTAMIDNVGPPIAVAGASYLGGTAAAAICTSSGAGAFFAGACAAVGGVVAGQLAAEALDWLD